VIVYLDTSSLVKLYVEEDGSSTVDRIVRSSDVAATSLIAYVEARAAFARRFRERAFTQGEYGRLKTVFEKDWSNYLVLGVTENMVVLAGDLSEKHALRGFDSIHLASAVTLRQELSVPIIFSCFDENLQKASECEHFERG
jgi:predicted nucleic acid-binding protein